jgi:flavin-dependent dehydrogenase
MILEPIEREPAVIIVGAGTAGLTLAWKLASRDVRVLVVEKHAQDEIGRTWINGVEERLFTDVGLPRPRPPLRFAERQRFVIQAPSGARLLIHNPAVAEIDMRRLSQALFAQARLAGARFRFNTEVVRLRLAADAVAGVVMRDRDGSEEQPRARCVVHAGGHRPLPGTSALGSSAPGGAVPPEDLCIAQQEVYTIDDPSAARRYLRENELQAGDSLSRIGVRGGYAISNITIDPGRGEAAFLTGAMLAQGPKAARQMLDEARGELGFLGRKLFGGGGLIPVRRPHERLIAPGYALLGDAAGQVYPAHGSGVATGMRAALLLANTLVGALRSSEPIDEEALWPYAALFMRSRGALCAAAEVTRRFAESLSRADADALIGRGLLREEMSQAVLACLPFRPPPQQLPALLRRVICSGGFGWRLLGALRRAVAQERHYRHFPAAYSPQEFLYWAERARHGARA